MKRVSHNEVAVPADRGSGVQQAGAGREFAIRTAPPRDPRLDPEKATVSPGEIEATLRQATGLNRTDPILRNPRRDRDIANAADATRLCASRAEGVPSNRVFAVIDDVRLQAWKGRHRRVLDFAIQQPNLGWVQNRARVPGQLLLKSHER
jgi:hypothetical protein